MNDYCEIINTPIKKSSSEIRNFYTGQTVFLTGCTGFLGKCIVEKLLRSCPELKKLYLLVRTKKNVPANDRIQQYFEHYVFDKLRAMRPDFQKTIVSIEGDLVEPGLGISTENHKMLIETTDIIIHNGATVKFDAQISLCLQINVLGTKKVLDLASECSNLKIFMYISTAFSHCYQQDIEEKFYPPPGDLTFVYNLIKADSETPNGLSNKAMEKIRDKWTNNYTFTKSIAESLVEEYGKKVPFHCAIYRPSVVTSSYREPTVSWCDNKNGPIIACISIAMGVLHSFYLEDVPFDSIPVDMTVNSLLAAIWYISKESKENSKDLQIFNNGSGLTNPITFRKIHSLILPDIVQYPTEKAVWYPYVFLLSNKYFANIMNIFVHVVPAILCDIVFLLLLRKPKMLSYYFKIKKYEEWLLVFSNGDWAISTTNMQKVWNDMSSVDRELFYGDIRTLCWEDYFTTYWKGVRMYQMNETMDNLEKARKRCNKLQILNYITLTIITLLFLYGFFKIVNYVFRF